MTKKDKDQLGYSIALIVFLLLIMARNVFSFIPIMYFIVGALAISFIVGESVKAMIPTKKTKRKTTKKKTTNKAATKKTTNKKATNNAPKKGHNQLRGKKEILTLPFDQLTWREFERLCFYYFEAKGQKPKETGEGADGGIDLIIWNKEDNGHEAVQIKKYTKQQVDVRIIRELNTAKKNHKCMLARLITTSDISLAAMREADDNRIATNDKTWVQNKLLTWRDQEAKRLKYIK
ncbi:hypothetical protein HMI01_26110 [Halolactibacillus miurensis]|uniref:Restriction system protein n=1 Tax=Halolactibacillus miurensis TaxID=306541 RepID=A0A1I6UTL2_9BACI|nr:restriction endonuclease [Halolactibacillus miurensis]GEM05623.1 hypothetical protein HMI01_26110 [Halolactibacillus miurensis]SFT04664.1 restriction system protein [Halolactibacillus miurensis]